MIIFSLARARRNGEPFATKQSPIPGETRTFLVKMCGKGGSPGNRQIHGGQKPPAGPPPTQEILIPRAGCQQPPRSNNYIYHITHLPVIGVGGRALLPPAFPPPGAGRPGLRPAGPRPRKYFFGPPPRKYFLEMFLGPRPRKYFFGPPPRKYFLGPWGREPPFWQLFVLYRQQSSDF